MPVVAETISSVVESVRVFNFEKKYTLYSQNKGHRNTDHFAPDWLKITLPLVQDSDEVIWFEIKQKTSRGSFLIT